MFTKKPSNMDIKEGASATFEATVKGKPLPEVTWSKADEKIESSERVAIVSEEVKGQLKVSLTLNDCPMDDAGEIRVTAVNPAGEDSCVAKLKIKSKLTPSNCISNTHTHSRMHPCLHTHLCMFVAISTRSYRSCNKIGIPFW